MTVEVKIQEGSKAAQTFEALQKQLEENKKAMEKPVNAPKPAPKPV